MASNHNKYHKYETNNSPRSSFGSGGLRRAFGGKSAMLLGHLHRDGRASNPLRTSDRPRAGRGLDSFPAARGSKRPLKSPDFGPPALRVSSPRPNSSGLRSRRAGDASRPSQSLDYGRLHGLPLRAWLLGGGSVLVGAARVSERSLNDGFRQALLRTLAPTRNEEPGTSRRPLPVQLSVEAVCGGCQNSLEMSPLELRRKCPLSLG